MKTSCFGRNTVLILVLLLAICAHNQAQASWIRDPVAIEMSLEVNPYSNEYPFHGVSSGHDYNGAPIYFILDGRFFLEQSMVRVDIDMYSDPSYTMHIRTDRAEACSWNEWFYDLTCDLTRDTSAGCRPLWLAVKFTESQSGTEGGFCPRPDMNIIIDSCPGTLGLY